MSCHCQLLGTTPNKPANLLGKQNRIYFLTTKRKKNSKYAHLSPSCFFYKTYEMEPIKIISGEMKLMLVIDRKTGLRTTMPIPCFTYLVRDLSGQEHKQIYFWQDISVFGRTNMRWVALIVDYCRPLGIAEWKNQQLLRYSDDLPQNKGNEEQVG